MAADYSQLELRLIAHLSKDRKLIDILNGGNDVFKMIASQWQGIPIDLVTAEQRQHAKGVCETYAKHSLGQGEEYHLAIIILRTIYISYI